MLFIPQDALYSNFLLHTEDNGYMIQFVYGLDKDDPVMTVMFKGPKQIKKIFNQEPHELAISDMLHLQLKIWYIEKYSPDFDVDELLEEKEEGEEYDMPYFYDCSELTAKEFNDLPIVYIEDYLEQLSKK